MKSKFDELLPFYVNGTLGEADRAWVETWLCEHPTASAELRWYESLQRRLHEDAPPVSSEVGLERVMARIRREGPAPQAPRRAAAPSWLERLRDGLAALVPQPVLRPVLAGALAVVVLQAGVIGHLAGDDDELSEIRAVPPAGVVERGPYLKVNFKPDAREAEIRLLLVESGASLAAGPGQLGDYYLRVSEAGLAAADQRLRASAIVDGVAVVDALPAR